MPTTGDHPTTGEAVRRLLVGDEAVDRALADPSPGTADFQAHLAESVWSRWARPGLGLRERSLVTLAIVAAQGLFDEFALHLGASRQAGVDDHELDELVMHLTAYCGGPTGVAARRRLAELRAAELGGGR